MSIVEKVFSMTSPQIYTLLAVTLAGAAMIRFLWIVIYRLFFHPLANIPGPLLARAFFFYSFWYNSYGAQFYLQIEKLHKQYGPVVRITPDEIHLSDPENCEKIYYVGSRYDKPPAFYGAFGTDKSTFTTPGFDEHRVKRSALNPFFSRKRVIDLEDVVQQKAKKLVSCMRKAFDSSGRIDLHYALRAISIDVITDYAFDNCFDYLDEEEFGVSFFKMIRDLGPAFWFFQQFPWIQGIALNAPLLVAKLISSSLTKILLHHEGSRRQIVNVKDAVEKGEKVSRKTIFHDLLQPDAAEGYVVPTVDQLKDEAYIILAAASDTTGNALTIATYNVVTNAKIYERLTTELKQAFPDLDGEMDFVALEKLPYLTGVIKEALRLSFGVIGRLPRVVPNSGAEFNGYYFPEGTIVSMSSWTMHHNEDLFPDAETFDPLRWTDPTMFKSLDKYLFSFGKGSRQCIGMSLAYCELYVTLGRLFRRFDDLKTRKKTRDELMYEDHFTPFHPEGNTEFIFERVK